MSAKLPRPASAISRVARSVTSPRCQAKGRLVDYLRGRFRSAAAVAASAGKNDSIESSEVVTSTAVPKVATVPNNDSSPPSGVSRRSGIKIPLAAASEMEIVIGQGKARHLLEQRGHLRVSGDRDLMLEPLDEVRHHLAKVDDPGHQLSHHPVHRVRGLEQRRVEPLGQRQHRGVRGDDGPAAVDDQRRVRLVAAEDQVERLAHRRQLGVLERALGERRSVAGGEQQPIALAERNLELLGEQQHHPGARRGAAGLDEAQMPSRDPGVERQVELGAPPPRAPLAQQRPDPGLGAHSRHLVGRL